MHPRRKNPGPPATQQRQRTQLASDGQLRNDNNVLKTLGRTGFESPSPAGCQHFLDAGRAVDQLGDVSLGGGPIGLVQGQERLPAEFNPG